LIVPVVTGGVRREAHEFQAASRSPFSPPCLVDAVLFTTKARIYKDACS
jgi:hypothetical protein